MPDPVRLYRFGPFTLDLTSFRLLRDGAPVSLTSKALDLLRYLVERPGALITKQELFGALWPDVAVTDNALTQAISDLRHALGDAASSPAFIQTVARRGYRFVCEVQAEQTPAGAGPSHPSGIVFSIAVCDFANLTGDPSVGWLATGIAETVTNDLRALGAFRVVDRVRVADAVRRGVTAPAQLGADLDLDLLVVGSFQRAGDRLRIAARVIAPRDGDTIADAKVDGELSEVFLLQDRLAQTFAAALGASRPETPEARQARWRETASLEAYRAFTEARLRLETLDRSLVPDAIRDFERAIELDPDYAIAYCGLANAHFWSYETTRDRNQPDHGALLSAIKYAQRAIELDDGLADAHASLAYFLVAAGAPREAITAARHAATLEPLYWGHQFRRGHAAWGSERIQALMRALELYPEFPYAHLEIAMVYIARGALDAAEEVLRRGAALQDRQAGRRERFPARGLHWLLGVTRLARGDADEALAEFACELAGDDRQLYAREFAVASWNGRGLVLLQRQQFEEALATFRRALALTPGHARAHVGAAEALRRLGRGGEATDEDVAVKAALQQIHDAGRLVELTLVTAMDHAANHRRDEALTTLSRVFDQPGPAYTGWTIPVEPLLQPLQSDERFRAVLAQLAERAR